MEQLWLILKICAVCAAILNICINLFVILNIRMTFNCNYMLTEYTMAAVVLLMLLKKVLNNSNTIIIIVVLAAIWIATTLVFRIQNVHFIRIYGVKRNMHQKLKSHIEKTALEHSLDRTNVYIYGGDSKTPCNTLIFRHVKKSDRQSILADINKYLRHYSTNSGVSTIPSLLCDIAVIYMVVAGII